MRIVIWRVIKACCWAAFSWMLLWVLRYLPVERNICIADEYEVLVYRDKFDLICNPGGGSDASGFCIVRDLKGRCSSSVYYLGMLWFASDLSSDQISEVNGRVVVSNSHFRPVRMNLFGMDVSSKCWPWNW